jgi:serine/threonine protein kinase
MSLMPLLAVALIVLLVFWLWRYWSQKRHLSQLSPSESPALLPKSYQTSPESITRDILLLELKARGRFSTVWKAKFVNVGLVAVKVFPEREQQSWLTETSFYSQPIIADHQNILRFIGCERRGSEFWLITEYHEIGSLYDYLKSNTVTLSELVSMATSMCSGLAFLHSAIGSKPPVAHRDIKSRNVLLRHDMTTCIADFGLALPLSNQPGDAHGQV